MPACGFAPGSLPRTSSLMSTTFGMRASASFTIQPAASGCALTGTLKVQGEPDSSLPATTSARLPDSHEIWETFDHGMRRTSPFSIAMPGAPTRSGVSLLVPTQMVAPVSTAPAAIRYEGIGFSFSSASKTWP